MFIEHPILILQLVPLGVFKEDTGKRFHLLFDIGPQYYFDTEGNGGVYPIMAQLNLGIDLGN